MLADLFVPQSLPFAVALGLMLIITFTEVLGMLMGMAPSAAFDSILPEFDMDAEIDAEVDVEAPDGTLSQVLGWLCFGKVPALVLLVIFLAAFGLCGLALQSFFHGVTGFYIPALIALLPALLLAFPFTRFIALRLSKVMPKEHTEAVSQSSFIGKIATITRGEAKRGLPAEGKTKDTHGQTHYLLIEPDHDEENFPQGSKVLIVFLERECVSGY